MSSRVRAILKEIRMASPRGKHAVNIELTPEPGPSAAPSGDRPPLILAPANEVSVSALSGLPPNNEPEATTA